MSVRYVQNIQSGRESWVPRDTACAIVMPGGGERIK